MNYRNKGRKQEEIAHAIRESANKSEDKDACKFLCPLKKEIQKVQ